MTVLADVNMHSALVEYVRANGGIADLQQDNCWYFERNGVRIADVNGYTTMDEVVWTHLTIPKPNADTVISIYDTWQAAETVKLTELATLTNAQNVALNQAKSYLRKQLMNANPDMSVIFPIVKGFVDANPALLQMVNNQIDLNRSAFTWPALNLVTPAAVDRTRYLRSVEDVISLIG